MSVEHTFSSYMSEIEKYETWISKMSSECLTSKLLHNQHQSKSTLKSFAASSPSQILK